jgi:anti-sigma regulatory factor (Ser/Thr protein kinase)
VKDQQAVQPATTPRALVTEALEDGHWPAAQPEVATRVFPGRHDQVACARAFVRAALGPVPVVDEAVLLVSELCTNALLHTASGKGGTFEVAVYPGSFSVRVEVRDGGANQAPGVRQPAAHWAEEGRGLSLVELLADRWGYSGDRSGRSVFFELHWKQPD